MTVLFFIISLSVVALITRAIHKKDLLGAVMEFTGEQYSSLDMEISLEPGLKYFKCFFYLVLRVIYLLCFLFYIKLNLKMWMRDGVMTKLAWKFGSITVLIVISALDHLIQQPSGKRKWLILIYLLIPVLWYLQSIA